MIWILSLFRRKRRQTVHERRFRTLVALSLDSERVDPDPMGGWS